MRLAQIAVQPGHFVHRQGVWWHEAPIPHRLHLCSPWSRGRLTHGAQEIVDRCACGAVRLHGAGPWTDRNSRRPR